LNRGATAAPLVNWHNDDFKDDPLVEKDNYLRCGLSLPVLRVARMADLERLHRFEILCFREHPFRRDHIAWILGNENAVALVQDGAEGLTAAMLLLFEGRACRVLSVGVAPRARRRGIATQMMQAAEAICRERGFPSIRLEVSTQNLPAIELYRRLGYRTDGVLYGYYSWGEDAYSMGKTLSPPVATKASPPRARSHIQVNKY
jgi:ribosomal protein S18 acetylase RimI-like enzyme